MSRKQVLIVDLRSQEEFSSKWATTLLLETERTIARSAPNVSSRIKERADCAGGGLGLAAVEPAKHKGIMISNSIRVLSSAEGVSSGGPEQ